MSGCSAEHVLTRLRLAVRFPPPVTSGGVFVFPRLPTTLCEAANVYWPRHDRSRHVPVRHDTGPRVVTITDNYDRLRYLPDAVTRDRRYTRYIGDGQMLRSHTSAHIPALLRALAAGGPDDVVLSVPGICYRRDVIDRHHVGEPHQMDIWRIRRGGQPLGEADLIELIELVVATVLPAHTWRTPPNEHPYTLAGREIYVRVDDDELEIGECGLAHPGVLRGGGLPTHASGLAMGLGLDRLTMLAKGIDDIRLLRSADPRVAKQMRNLQPYRPVSTMPAARRDLSIAVPDALDAELLGDRVHTILGTKALAVEEVIILSETAYVDLPAPARARLGMSPEHKNVLLRLIFRDLDRTLSSAQANRLRDLVYVGLHVGSAAQWASNPRESTAAALSTLTKAAPPQ
jgi:phenylalanyl-tRNA synthetase alpha chain